MSNAPGLNNRMLLKRSYLPICASCSKVRSADGVWARSPLAFGRPADVHLTHGFCPDCAREVYRDMGGRR